NLDRLQAQFVFAQTKLATAEGEVSEARSLLRERAVSAYVSQPSAHAADMVLRAGSMRELAATIGYLEAMVAAQKAAVDRYTKLRDDTAALREAAEVTKNEAMAQRNVVLSRVAALESVRQQQDAVRQEVLGQEREQSGLVEEVRSRKAEFQAQINALRAESDAVSGLIRGVQDGQAVTPSGKGVLAVPLPGARITSFFGPRMHPIYHEVRTHDGLDFAAGTGTPIHAAGDGVVIYAGPRGGYGNATVVDHGNSLATLYAHQSAIQVAVGQRVARNEVIGLVGSTGFSTGPHLHFEVRVQGTPVDPMRYL
ncbi:MAG TPA: M23 family metallopeptidase, partial [Acidimicrobiales bacterium]